ncbi:MAG TPA: hypothetical protein VKY92_08445 [Verrucomicrobiae bacterium]|nr:hypothetical protein [Verrucomicrobiae bacterium]
MSTNYILLFGVVLAIAMAVVVGVFVGRRRVGDCLVIFSSMLGSAMSDLFPSPSTTKTRLVFFALVTLVVVWVIYLFVAKRMRFLRKPSV